MDATGVRVLAPFVGRTAERDIVAATYALAAAGRSRVLLITGEAGIGKTRLVGELREHVEAADGDACWRVGESVPAIGVTLAYGPFLAALGEDARWLIAERGDDPLAVRQRRFERALALLSSLSSQAPTVLVLEDLHWADESSRHLLAFLAVSLREQRVMIIATMRDDELDAAACRWLAELEQRPRVTRLRLTRLADADIADLVSGLPSDDADEARLAEVVSAAEGNPFYAEELARSGSQWPPASIADAVLAKTSDVDISVREVIDQISVADHDMPHDLLAEVVSLPEPVLLAATRQAVALRLLITTCEGYAFRRTLTRQIFYRQLLPGDRRRLHRRLAGALARREESDPARLARHWRLGGRADRAVEATLVAARQAVSSQAYLEAHSLFTTALGLARWSPDQGSEVLEDAACAASLAGDPARAVALITQALADCPSASPEDRARLLERLCQYRCESGDPEAAIQSAQSAARLLEGSPPSATRARVLISLATSALLSGEPETALPAAVRAVEAAEHAGAVVEQVKALATLGGVQTRRGDLDAGFAVLHASIGLARQTGDADAMLYASINHIHLLSAAGRFTEALRVAHDGEQMAAASHAPPPQIAALRAGTAATLIAIGRWAHADQLLTELVDQSGACHAARLRLLCLELAVARGDRSRATELAAPLTASSGDPSLLASARACLAEQALFEGDLVSAANEALDGLAAVDGGGLAHEEIRLLAITARISADLACLPGSGRASTPAGRWGPALANIADRVGVIVDHHRDEPVVSAFGAMADAELARQLGVANRTAWRVVADAWRAVEHPYQEAYARLREAETAIRAGRRDRAARALAACVGLARHLSAGPLLEVALDLARRSRLADRLGPEAPSSADQARLDLTERETQVFKLLTSGRSNRQIAGALFISERTVAVHVSHIFNKLGVRNRTEAAAIGARAGMDACVAA